MSNSPYPGFEEAPDPDIIQLRFFKFTANDYGKTRILFTLPINSMVYGWIGARLEESFKGGQPITYEAILTLNNGVENRNIARILLGISDSSDMVVNSGLLTDYFRIISVPTEMTIIVENATNNDIVIPTQGSGYGIIQWIDLSKVRGYPDGII